MAKEANWKSVHNSISHTALHAVNKAMGDFMFSAATMHLKRELQKRPIPITMDNLANEKTNQLQN